MGKSVRRGKRVSARMKGLKLNTGSRAGGQEDGNIQVVFGSDVGEELPVPRPWDTAAGKGWMFITAERRLH